MSGAALPAAAAPGRIDDRLADALAEELVALTGVLAELAYDLAADEATLRRHMASLQTIDRVTQTQLALADMLRTDDSLDARIAGITLDEVAQRLRARLAL